MKRIMCASAFFITFVLGAFVCALAGPLPDTGQTKCSNNSAEITCPEAGEDFYGQDASYLINPPSHTKLDAEGNDLPDSTTAWSMVRDNVTGLIWEVKTDDGSIHDEDNTYTWQDAQDVFIAELNSSSFGGHSDWRLPNVKEFQSIADYQRTNPAIDTDYFPDTVSSHYWSSTTHNYYTSYAWYINFYFSGNGNYDKSSSYYVRAVRGGQIGSFDNLVINGDGTVTDTSNGLMWQQATASSKNWKSTLSYCEGLSVAGYTDWRLPNFKESLSIVDYGRYDPAIDTDYFPDTVSSHYWSSTALAGGFWGAWIINFHGGYDVRREKSNSYYVRAVRGGQNQLTGHLVISAPAQASSWNVGASMSITWDTRDISGNVKISISRQGGKDGTFETIAESTENDGTYNWTVTGTASVNCVLKIEPIDDSSKGTTQGLFTMETIIYVEPNGECGGDTPCYSTIQAAIDAAETESVIKILQGTFDEDIIMDQAYDLTLSGGWDSTFTTQSSNTVIHSLTITGTGGTVEMENMVLQ